MCRREAAIGTSPAFVSRLRIRSRVEQGDGFRREQGPVEHPEVCRGGRALFPGPPRGHEPPNVRSDDPAQSTDSTSDSPPIRARTREAGRRGEVSPPVWRRLRRSPSGYVDRGWWPTTYGVSRRPRIVWRMAPSSASTRRRGVDKSRRSEARRGHSRHPRRPIPEWPVPAEQQGRRKRPDPGLQLTGANQDVRRGPGKRQTIRIATSLATGWLLPARVRPSYAHSRGRGRFGSACSNGLTEDKNGTWALRHEVGGRHSRVGLMAKEPWVPRDGRIPVSW